MSTIFTCPGRMGDALLQWPVAWAWARENKKPFTVWLDRTTCAFLKPLLEVQPWVEAVELKDGIQHWQMGGQPWNFGLETADYEGHTVYHLGMRAFPQKQITLQTVEWVPIVSDTRALAEKPSLEVSGPATGADEPVHDRLVLHGTFQTYHSGTPGFWRFLNARRAELEGLFSEITFVGTPEERKRALELYPAWSDFDDRRSALEVAWLMKHSRAVIACGSSMSHLAGALKVPCIRVHDPIGDHPRVIWSNLGANQTNETEQDLRKLWPEWRDRWLAPEPAPA